ncbi:MAG: carboxymuconolactone decarboxylase family protein [Polyangiales bacterium]
MNPRVRERALLVEPCAKPSWLLRPALWLAAKIAKKDTAPARILAHFTKGALGAAVIEACAPSASDLDGRSLAFARIAASVVAGCPFCVDMNAATWRRAGISPLELQGVMALDERVIDSLSARESTAVRFAIALSRTPVTVDEALATSLRERFSERERVALAEAIALVNFWSRFNQAMGVGSAGFFDESACRIEAR